MKKFEKIIVPVLTVLTFLLIFWRWFGKGVLSGGDWPYLYPKALGEVVPFSTWDMVFNNGLGQSSLPKIWFDSYSLTIVKLAQIISWPFFERIVWFFPYVLISFFGACVLSKKFFDDSSLNFLSGLIYTANTYSILIVSGGQVGVFMAYAFLPFTFCALLNLIDRFNLKRSMFFSVVLAVQIILDLRVGYMFLAAGFLLGSIYLIYNKKNILVKLLYLLGIPGLIVFFLHFFWILPIILTGKNPASQFTDIYTSSASLSFFSFAKFENAIGLLHPNWPENIFGKVAFLKPEFLLIPVLAFTSLLFVEKEEKAKRNLILSLVVLAIIASFLAKGTNDPFGQFYSLFFNKIPGFVMFRDPTKWYMLIAIPFSILIPYTLGKVSSIQYLVFRKKYSMLNTRYPMLICVLFICLWAFIIRDALLGNVKGTLYTHEIPQNYVELANKISSDDTFYRTLWVPNYPSLAYNSNTHPAIPATEFFKATSLKNLIQDLNKPNALGELQDASVKYVIIPDDVYGKIFLTDRKYDEKVYKSVVHDLVKNANFRRLGQYGKIIVFEVDNSKAHFWSSDSNLTINTEFSSPTKYKLKIENAKKNDLFVFSESFDNGWVMKNDDTNYKAVSNKYPISNTLNLNSFVLPANGSYSLEIYFRVQEWLEEGLVVSGLTLLIVIALIVKLKD